jgi:hypothetical protein
LARAVEAEDVEGLALQRVEGGPPLRPIELDTRRVLYLHDALRRRVGRGARVVHEAPGAGEEGGAGLEREELVRGVAVVDEDGEEFLDDTRPAVEQRLDVSAVTLGRAID